MSELQKLVRADNRFEEAVEMLRDLLEEENRDRLMLALKVSGGPEVEDMQRTLRFMDWLFMQGQEHLDAMLADIHDIDLARANQERKGLRRSNAVMRRASEIIKAARHA
ncbi:MAG: hypothetical protein KQI62_02125 [Deltaproteobacteria bacterium]|nr:hypothetical protein [Deltaproteobacteria bacterium]